jgi:aspartate aminotransferase
MLENLKQQPSDKILALMQKFTKDIRENKLDLGIGVYKNELGKTPIMESVKKAEKILWLNEDTKSYTKLAGDLSYLKAMKELILADSVDDNRVSAAHTPGGTGAIRQGFELIKIASPTAKIWVSNPTWPNHISILNFLNMPHEEYIYFDKNTRDVNFDGMMSSLNGAKPGDIVLLHGCCHNPTGANLNQIQWHELVSFLINRKLLPFVDIAYQGFGNGLIKDAYGVRLLAKHCEEIILAASCSKNFGIYRERTGIIFTVSKDEKYKKLSQSTLAFLNRQNFSFPPYHGGKLVSLILNDKKLKKDWMNELDQMRLNMLEIRKMLVKELRALSGSDRFDFLGKHRGMFSLIGASKEQVIKIREKHAIYMIEDSRINIASLNKNTVSTLANAIIDVDV